MPGQRMIHPEQGMSRKVTSLSDFEYRVFEQSKLSSDDFGVMPYTSTILRAHNSRLRKATEKQVFDALRRIVQIGLLLVFDDQDETYVCAPVWQTWQTISFPRRTSYPKPPQEILDKCDDATRQLFDRHPGGKKPVRKNSTTIPESTRNQSPPIPPSIPDPIPSSFQKKTRTSDVEVPANADADAYANANARESARGTPLVMSPLRWSKLRETHAFVGSRLRVPHVFHEELRAKLGGENPDGRLTAFYESLNTDLEATGEPVLDVFTWLRPKFVEWAQSSVAASDRASFLQWAEGAHGR